MRVGLGTGLPSGAAGATGPGWVVPDLREPVRTIGRRTFDFDHRIAVMAIVNRTPDSFHDKGRTFALDCAVQAAVTAAEQGADWVDIGGVKFAPGPELSAADEIERVLPVVEQVAQQSDVTISVDTFRPEVAAAAIAAGASVVNDTTGLTDPRMAAVVADSDATIVITHSLAARGRSTRSRSTPTWRARSRPFCDCASTGRSTPASPRTGSSSTRDTTSTRRPCTRSN
jgi:dihydropteroate synthase